MNNEFITMSEAARLLDVSLSSVSYYVRTGKLPSVPTTRRTTHRKPRRLVRRLSVMELKQAHDEQDARHLDAEPVR